MEFRAASSPKADVALTPLGRRSHYRHQVQSLAYVNLDQTNGGIIRNLGDAGIAIQAVAPLYLNQQVFLRFDLSNPRVRVEATGRVAWSDPVGQAGVEFVLLSPRSKRMLKEWVFTQLLAYAQHSSGGSGFLYGQPSAEDTELLFSAGARPAIRLPKTNALPDPAHTQDVRALPWLPFAMSATALSRLVDGLILLSSLLLFALICIAMVGFVPAWPVALTMGIGVAAVFAVLYRFLFRFWIGCTPGDWLAGLAGDACEGNEMRAEDRPRFR